MKMPFFAWEIFSLLFCICFALCCSHSLIFVAWAFYGFTCFSLIKRFAVLDLSLFTFVNVLLVYISGTFHFPFSVCYVSFARLCCWQLFSRSCPFSDTASRFALLFCLLVEKFLRFRFVTSLSCLIYPISPIMVFPGKNENLTQRCLYPVPIGTSLRMHGATSLHSCQPLAGHPFLDCGN